MGLSQRLRSQTILERESRIKNRVGVLESPLSHQPLENLAIGEKQSQKESDLKWHELKKRRSVSGNKVLK